jgi:predicted regulator of Ras-like GTPase activity (Roadblock/LC7/MglB family)
MGLVSGAVIGAAQGLVLARQEKPRFGAAWGAAMPLLFGAGWAATTVIGISVEDQFTVFGASGALVFMALSGLLLARFTPSSTRVA